VVRALFVVWGVAFDPLLPFSSRNVQKIIEFLALQEIRATLDLVVRALFVVGGVAVPALVPVGSWKRRDDARVPVKNNYLTEMCSGSEAGCI